MERNIHKFMQVSASEMRLKVPLLLAALVAVVVVVMGIVFYARGATVMKSLLRERLRSTAAVAAMQFNGDSLRGIQSMEDMNSPVFIETVERLKEIRSRIPDIEYAYIMRRTEDPMTLMFVADADSLSAKEETDENSNGIIDPDEELSFPGELYDVSEIPIMQNEAFEVPSVDTDITYDQWGALISGYAPITNSAGEVVAIIGLDMTAGNYLHLSRSAFSSVSVLLFFMMAVLLAVCIVLFTWRHRMETLRQLDQERGALVGLALHQLGTPLSIFRWWVEILEEKYGEQICEETDACLQLEEGIKRLENVFNELKDAHDISQGKLEYTRTDASLRHIVEAEVENANERLQHRKQIIHIDIPEDVIMKLDSKLISGVISELLENAITYSTEGAKTVVSVRENGNSVVVSVQDSGCGIPKNDMSHIFKKFIRGEGAHKFKAVGNGLGLFMAKGIVEEAGGKIWVESKEGKGTTVSFSLPLSKKKNFLFFS